ncbi:MAG: TonB-dependent receptor plug domain-containing protein [Gammaproteobacteria bacterium]|nr:TonB-dependent receptor plug domain-containing protein [Gammaproteobacteria bacterium]
MKFKISIDYRLCNYPLGFLLLFSSTSLFAADDELFFEMPIVLSANRLEQPVSDAAVSISVIDRETIEASGARTIPEVLRLVPGMQVGFSGNQFGDEPKYVVTYHGHSNQYSKQMQVLIDGRSIYEPLTGGILWKTIPVNIDDIERIEVSRGPNLATYGSNSFQAAINIITRTAAEDQGSYVRTNIGNHDIADLTYRYGGSSGNLDYRITGSTLNDDGLDSKNDIDYPDDTNSNNIDYRLDYQINNNNTLSYQGGYGENRQQADRNHDIDGPLPTARTVENTRFFQFIKLESAINAENTIQLQYYYNLSDRKDSYSSDTIVLGAPIDEFELDIDDDVKAERHNLELTHSIYPDKDLKLVWGLSAQADFVRAPQALGNDEKAKHQQYRGFANIEWHVNQSNIINLGGLVEKNSFSETELSPRASFTHAFNKQHKVRFGISQAIRSPFIYEEMANSFYSQDLTVNDGDPAPPPIPQTARELVIIGNPDLKNEKITSREIVYYGDFLNSSLLFNARFFHDDVTNYIDTLEEPVDPALDNFNGTADVFRNPIDSETNGLELELDYRINPTLRLIASGAIINISSDSNAIAHSAPQHSYSLLLTKRFTEKYNGSLGYYYVDEFKWTDARDISLGDEVSTDDYHALDLRLSRNFNFSQTHGSLSLVLKNLLSDYSDYQKHQINSTAPVAIQNTVAYIDFRLSF